GISYLADNIVFIQYLERFEGRKVELRKAIGVLKKRLSSFERTIREYEVTSSGLRVSDPLPDLDHIIGGLPRWAVSSEGTGG
ncbi:MAG TPA: recombinase RecA, partial [Cyanobacteria bacterium UBA8530]|nr:recombinase RecA [Cyanobacteria bacterium UBA8530]